MDQHMINAKARRRGRFQRMLSESGVAGGSRYCPRCPRVFSTHREMVAHVVFDHTENREKYICPTCKRVYASQQGLSAHTRHRCVAPEPAVVTQELLAVDPPTPLAKRPAYGPTLKCGSCDDLFDSAVLLSDHCIIVHHRQITRDERTPV